MRQDCSETENTRPKLKEEERDDIDSSHSSRPCERDDQNTRQRRGEKRGEEKSDCE
jgi:hypothetical protein